MKLATKAPDSAKTRRFAKPSFWQFFSFAQTLFFSLPPLFVPPSGPAQRLFLEPPAKCKFPAAGDQAYKHAGLIS